MNYCQNCGSPCKDFDLFCKTCGTKLENPSPPVQNNPAPASPVGPGMRPYNENFSAGGQNPAGNAPGYGSGAANNTYGVNPGYRYPNAGNINGGYDNYANTYSPRPPAYPYYNAGPRNNGFATASMVLGIVGLVMLSCDGLGFFPAILAIIFSCVSKSAIKKSNGAETGKGMATAGLILGIVAVAVVILIILAIVILVSLGVFNSNTNFGFPSGQTYNT